MNSLPLILPLIRIGALQDLYNAEVTTYKQHLPRLFWYNAFILVSNGRKSQLGSMTASREFFFEWKRIHQETDPPDTRVETILQGTCDKTHLLDIVENFTLFSTEKEALAKIIARNHQYLGVNAAYEHLQKRQPAERKLGVFWHTQGAGKSYSMVFFAQKVLRKLGGHWTFVIATDRDDLDMRRGYLGKAMVVSIDKLTAIRTYNRVQNARKQAMETYRQRLSRETDPQRRQQLLDQLQYLGETDMAVVISKSDGDEDRAAELAAKTGEQIDIKIHHQRMVKENLEEKFKKADDALRIAFVCGMWMTGFDVPCLSTIYLDRPLHGHTLSANS